MRRWIFRCTLAEALGPQGPHSSSPWGPFSAHPLDRAGTSPGEEEAQRPWKHPTCISGSPQTQVSLRGARTAWGQGWHPRALPLQREDLSGGDWERWDLTWFKLAGGWGKFLQGWPVHFS